MNAHDSLLLLLNMDYQISGESDFGTIFNSVSVKRIGEDFYRVTHNGKQFDYMDAHQAIKKFIEITEPVHTIWGIV